MFNLFEWYETTVDALLGKKEPTTVDTVFLEFECPKEDADELSAVVANWLVEKGYDPEEFYGG